MDGPFIRKSDYSEIAPPEFFDSTPESIPVMLLRFNSEGVFQDPNAPLFAHVRPFSHHFILKIVSEPVFSHSHDNTPRMILNKALSPGVKSLASTVKTASKLA
jgi:hypothetical protein